MCSSKASILKVILQEDLAKYAILHSWQGLPEYLPSDLDIAVAPEDLSRLEQVLLRSEGARLVNHLRHESTCDYFVLALSDGRGVHFLPVDSATDYRRDERIWFKAEGLLQGRRKWKDFLVASPEVEFKYLLVKKILKGKIPPHSARRLQELAAILGERADAFAKELLGRRWATQVMTWIRKGQREDFEKNLPTLKKVLKRRKFLKDPLNPIRYWLPELKRIWRRWCHPTGIFVAILGPDGAGKSTLIEHLERDLAGAFRRTARFHLMPGIFRKRCGGGPVTNPHGKPPRSRFTSLLKLGYYLLDYTLGYLFKIRPALVKSTLVLFDRYYDDLLVDPRRYRYGGPMRLARWFRRFIPQPDLWLILDVPEEEIYRRKQEVPLEEIRRQRKAYRCLATELQNAVFLDGSRPLEELAREAEEVILEYMHERYLSRRGVWFPEVEAEKGREYLQKALGAQPSEEGKVFLHILLPDGRSYLLPPNSRKAAVQGLSLYIPQKPKAKLLKSVLNAGLRSGLAYYYLPRINLDLRDLEKYLSEIFGWRDFSLAMSLGTPGLHRKPVVQVMSQKGEVLSYMKMGWNEETRRLVENEALTLQRLQENSLPFLVPRVLFAGERQERFLCVQSPPLQDVCPAPYEWTSLYEEALKGMVSLGLKYLRLKESAFWKRLSDRVNRMEDGYWCPVVERSMERVLSQWGDEKLPFHPAHGDFTPWNAFLVNDGLYLYDWEYAFEEAPVGYDFFHFVVQRAWLVEGKAPTGILNTIKEHLNQVEGYWRAIGVDESAWAIAFELYLLDRLISLNFEQDSAQMKRNLAKLLSLWESVEWKQT